MSDTHTPADGPGPYPALGLTLAPGRIRNQTLLFIGVPFLLTVLVVVLLSTSGSGGDDPYYGGFPGGTSGDAFPGTDETDATTAGGGDDTPGGTGPAWTEDPTEAADPTDDATYGTEETTGGTVDDPAQTETSSVVTAYFEAINRGDYSAAWYLGGRNLDPDYDHFAAGFGTTARDEVTIDGAAGETVSVTFVAWHTDGSWQTYGGTYTVRGGEIVSADIQEKD